MNEKKLYILKEKLDIKIVLFAVFLVIGGNIVSIARNNYFIVSFSTRIIGSVLFLCIFYGFMIYKAIQKNNIILYPYWSFDMAEIKNPKDILRTIDNCLYELVC